MASSKNRNLKSKAGATVTSKKRLPKAHEVVYQGIQKSIDSVLLSLPNKVQDNIDQALKSFDSASMLLQDLRPLGYRVLQHAREITDLIKAPMLVKQKSNLKAQSKIKK